MLLIRRIEITNFACFDHIEITPATSAERPLTVIRAENGAGKTTLLRAIRWGMYGEKGLPGVPDSFSLHPASWQPDSGGIETQVSILFETDGSSRVDLEGKPTHVQYQLRRTVTTIGNEPASKSDPDFKRIGEDAQLHQQVRDGSWEPNAHGVRSVIEELLPWDLRDFFVMDADEAADFVGGSDENKVVKRQDVIGKTSYAVKALLGLEVFNNAAERITDLQRDFERAATKATRNAELGAKQEELDQVRTWLGQVEKQLEENGRRKRDTEETLAQSRGDLEAAIGSLAAHDQLRQRLTDNEKHKSKAQEELRKAAGELSRDLTRIDLLASLACREIGHAEQLLQPLYDDGSIPQRHLAWVKRLLESGTCVCGQDLSSPGGHADHVRHEIDRSTGQQERADHLAEVLHAATALHPFDGDGWEQRTDDHAQAVEDLERDIDDLRQGRRDIDAQLDGIDNDAVENARSRIDMLEKNLSTLDRDIASAQSTRDQRREDVNRLESEIRAAKRQESEARDLARYEEMARVLVQILREAYARIQDEQVRELDAEMNALFESMAANVFDDEALEHNQRKATLRMIAKVGLRPLEDTPEQYEIFALNSRGRSMPPTEINGASRRILALSFVLALCRVSHTRAPLIADSLLNFMSGSVRTNTLRVTAQTASQPILLLTGADLESENEIDIVNRYAGATYALTGQWQHVDHGGDVVNQTDDRQVSLLCSCGPREYCAVCERRGQAEDSRWTRRQVWEAEQ